MRHSYLSTHLMAGNWDEKQVCLIWIICSKVAFPYILKKVPLTSILPRKLPRRLVKRVWIAVRIYVNLEIPLHRLKVQLEHLRQVVDVRENVVPETFDFLIKVSQI